MDAMAPSNDPPDQGSMISTPDPIGGPFRSNSLGAAMKAADGIDSVVRAWLDEEASVTTIQGRGGRSCSPRRATRNTEAAR